MSHLADAKIQIVFYATRLSKRDLDFIRTVAIETSPRCVKLSRWLLIYVDDEKARQFQFKAGNLIEPTLAGFNPEDWQGAEPIDAALVCHTIAMTAPSNEIRAFAQKLLNFFLALAGCRLSDAAAAASETRRQPRKRS